MRRFGSRRVPYVMVIDDDPDAREVIQMALEARGWRVVAARHGREALDRLHQPGARTPDAIVLDLMMPVMDGLEFLKHRAADALVRRIPVVVTSAISGQAPALGAEAVLAKPFELGALFNSLRRLVAGPALA